MNYLTQCVYSALKVYVYGPKVNLTWKCASETIYENKRKLKEKKIWYHSQKQNRLSLIVRILQVIVGDVFH